MLPRKWRARLIRLWDRRWADCARLGLVGDVGSGEYWLRRSQWEAAGYPRAMGYYIIPTEGRDDDRQTYII